MTIFKRITICFLFSISLFFYAGSLYAQWQINGPFGGSVKCLTVVDTIVYAGTLEGGLYQSTNQNIEAWKPLYTVLNTDKINAIASMGSTVIVGSADRGIFISADQGATWIQKVNGLTNTNILSLFVNGTSIYAGTNGGGVFVSTSNGNSWTAVNAGLSNLTVNTITLTGTTLLAGTNGGIFYSINNAASWTAGNTGLSTLTVKSIIISGATLFAATTGGIYKTGTPAFNWSQSNIGLTSTYVNQIILSGATLYAATAGGVFSSTTSALSWTAASSGLPHDTITALALFENKLIAGTKPSGIYTTTLSSINWSVSNTGLNSLKTLALYVSDDFITVVTQKGLFTSRNQAASYVPSNRGLTDSINVYRLSFFNKKSFVATARGVFISLDTTKNWIDIFTTNETIFWITTGGNIGLPSNIRILWSESYDTTIVAGTDIQGVYKYRNGPIGLAWYEFNNTLMRNQQVTSFAFIENKIFAGTPAHGVFMSDLSTPTWIQINTGLPNQNITALVAIDQYLLAGYKGGLAFTSNNGTSWQTVDMTNFPSFAIINNIGFSTDRVYITTSTNSMYSIAKSELFPSLATGIFQQETTSTKNIVVSPNPNNGTFKVDDSALDTKISEISIYNYYGQLMNTFYDVSERIQVNYPHGIYYLQMRTSTNELISQKIIIQ
ncbi:MAG: C-terminal target protein [Chitinophagaceae bacterium]|nr:C-terminal target protein [Chitinophagaceae bacterium]